MIWRILPWLGALAIVIGGAVWISHGMQGFSKDLERVETVVKDELFGTEHVEVTFRPKYSFGLLPDDATIWRLPNSFAFVLGCGVTAMGVGLYMQRRRKRAANGKHEPK